MKKLPALIFLCVLGSSAYSNIFPNRSGTATSNSYLLQKGGLMELFRGLDPRILQSSDEGEIEKYLLPYNPQIVHYVSETYGENLTDYFEIDDPMLFLSGFLIAHFELYQSTQGLQAKMAPGEILQCVGSVIGFGKGVNEIIGTYNQLLNGTATFNTLWSVVKNIIRRYAGWFAVGYAIYQFGDCMDWW